MYQPEIWIVSFLYFRLGVLHLFLTPPIHHKEFHLLFILSFLSFWFHKKVKFPISGGDNASKKARKWVLRVSIKIKLHISILRYSNVKKITKIFPLNQFQNKTSNFIPDYFIYCFIIIFIKLWLNKTNCNKIPYDMYYQTHLLTYSPVEDERISIYSLNLWSKIWVIGYDSLVIHKHFRSVGY